jgi:chromatin assembly factor 1 subunit B
VGEQVNMNAQTPVMSQVPGLAAANSGVVGGSTPMWTPPLTPAQGHNSTHSASSSVSGIPGITGARRESESEREDGTSSSKKRDLQAVPEVEEARGGKRRRIAPTPVTVGASQDDNAIASTEENTPTAQDPS